MENDSTEIKQIPLISQAVDMKEIKFPIPNDTYKLNILGFDLKDEAGNNSFYIKKGYEQKMKDYFDALNINGTEIEKFIELQEIKPFTAINNLKVDETIKLEDLNNEKFAGLLGGKTYLIDTTENAKPTYNISDGYVYTNIIKADVFRQLARKDNVTFIFQNCGEINNGTNSGSFQWVINSNDIISSEIKNVDTSVSLLLKNNELIYDDESDIGKSTKSVSGMPAIFQYFIDFSDCYNEEEFTFKQSNEKVLDYLKNASYIGDGNRISYEYYYNYLKTLDPEKDNFNEEYKKALYKNFYINIKFADNGILPGKMKIRVDLEYAGKGYFPKQNVKMVFDGNENETYDVTATVDDRFEAEITHNSSYTIKAFDATNPLVNGIKSNDILYIDTTFTATDDGPVTVKINGKEVTSLDRSYVLKGSKDGTKYDVVVSDGSNTVEVKNVTVYSEKPKDDNKNDGIANDTSKGNDESKVDTGDTSNTMELFMLMLVSFGSITVIRKKNRA